MKHAFVLMLMCITGIVNAQVLPEQEVKTEVSEVAVFLDGAQVTRTKSVDVKAGQSLLKFTNLSPYIDPKSIQMKSDGELTVFAVNHQQNFLSDLEKPAELSDLEESLKRLEQQEQKENVYLGIVREEVAFLQANKSVGGRVQQMSVTTLEQAADFYGKRLTELKMKEIDYINRVQKITEQKQEIRRQIQTLSSTKSYASGEILVKIDAAKSGLARFELSYLVKNAGWFPSYDIRAKSILEPVQLVYKANVRQDTKVEWKNVKLRFSSTDPSVSGVAPKLQTYFLNYNTVPPIYKQFVNEVRGRITDSEGTALVGANVQVEGTTIGTVADMSGNYSITVPNMNCRLVYSFIGCVSQTLPVRSSVMNVTLQQDVTNLDEVVVAGYGTTAREALTGSVAGVAVDRSKTKEIKIRGMSTIPVETQQVEKQTAVDFEIEMPYSIPSDNKNYKVDMAVYELPADYQYYCVPKVNKDAFLIANINNWEKYNLLEGEANIFFEDTYVGKTLLDVRSASDTLEISLGRDKKVSVTREKKTDFVSKQFIGNKKEETREWYTVVKNNKNQPINLVLLDQIPVSTNEEIEVSLLDKSGAQTDPETGELRWELKLDPGKQKDVTLKYAVKYPKYKRLIIE